MPSLRRRLAHAPARLLLHRTTLDPFLDEDATAPRLGALTLHDVTHDALLASLASDFVVDIRAVAGATLRVPAAVVDRPGAAVTFDVRVEAAGMPPRARSLTIDEDRAGRWFTLALRVPEGRSTVTMRARPGGDEARARAVWGVPSITWWKPAGLMVQSLAHAVRAYGVAATARRLRGKLAEAGDAGYPSWFAKHAPDAAALEALRARAVSLTPRPRFALILDGGIADDRAARLQATLDSLAAQIYDDWDVWVPAALKADVPKGPWCTRVRTIAQAAGQADGRNAVLSASEADFVATIGAGDRLAPHALYAVAARLSSEPGIDVIYSDEDEWSARDGHREPRFKPDWSPDYLRARAYLGGLLCMRRSLVADAGGYRGQAGTALDFDAALRVTPLARRIGHVHDVLYHRAPEAAADPGSAHADAASVIADAYAAEGMAARVEPGAIAGIWRPRIALVDRPRIAIVIPTDARTAPGAREPLIVECVRNVMQRTDYPNVDLLVCDNGNLSDAARAYLATVPHTRVQYSWTGPFNFPRKINFAVAQTDAPYVLLLNDDVEPINRGWLTAMLEYAQQPRIGAVGAKLFYPDGRLQHVGVALGVGGVAAHLLHQQPGGTLGCGAIAVTARNCSAVTGACLLTRRRVYDEIGGFDEELALDFNDVDFCLRLGRAGYRIVYTPYARLFHHESASFGSRRQRPAEIAAMRRRWGAALEHDPYYNLNLSRQFPDCRLGSAPDR